MCSTAVKAAEEVSGPRLHFVANKSWRRGGLWERSQAPWWRFDGMRRLAAILQGSFKGFAYSPPDSLLVPSGRAGLGKPRLGGVALLSG